LLCDSLRSTEGAMTNPRAKSDQDFKKAPRRASEGQPADRKARQAREQAVDESLEQTFPASDPPPASRGAN
jgi:hypothetical protein